MREKSMQWPLLGLIFVVTIINYLDRAILGVLLPEIRGELQIGTRTYGNINFAFQMAYAAGALIGGKLLDKFGTRIGYAAAAAFWSAAATLSGLAGNVLQFGFFRALLGLGESANFPACNKAAAEIFAPAQRANVMGIANFGANLANVFGPPLFVWLALSFDWRTCFALIGGIGFLWVPAWLWAYRLGLPSSGSAELLQAQMPMKAVLRYRQTWGYALAKFLTDPVWWFYLYWIPTYLNDIRHFTAAQRAAALTAVYAVSSVGALLGGVISGRLIESGWQVGKARKTVMGICALMMPLTALGVVVESASLAVLLFSLATAIHSAWMTNLFTTPADVFPRHGVGSANGVGACVGALGGALFSGLIPGRVIPVAGYVPVLVTMSCFYLAAWIAVHKLMGNLEMIDLEPSGFR